MNQPHTDTIAIITGGAQGVGHAIASRLADEGCTRLMLTGRNEAKGARAVDDFASRGVDAKFVSLDLQNPAGCLALVERTVADFGDVNALVNAAALGARGSITSTTPELFDEMFTTNVRGPFFLIQGFVRHRLDQGGRGHIVNILSNCAHCGQSYLAPYSSSKGALATLTKNVANAHRFDRIHCNAILPGWMDTPGEDGTQRKYHGATDGWLERAEAGQPMGQLAKPSQLAELASYLLSEQSGVMTGALIDYDQNIPGAYPE
ncbi:SDR family oxidoreductase [Martelella mediterranea]|uniref:SDR family oxidoreductase n=1 Tax=Martelella mediterranea TaxID=293089 RepID=UPI001E2DFAE7|nr:SDR family oxidoreductase [Martelella mediterranea]MCD1636383.1 SDR family oxidoreductase [Martelella mediterranea]